MKSRNRNKLIAAIFIALTAALLFYGRYIEPAKIAIKEIIVTPEFSPALKGKIILHISDLHIDKFGEKETNLLNQIEQARPDLIFLTGDYIEWKKDNSGALQFLSRLKATHGVFAVMGDYDYSFSRTSCLFCHNANSGGRSSRHDVNMLRNTLFEVQIENENILIAGMGEEDEGSELLQTILKGLEKEMPLLVLSHSPFAFDRFSKEEKRFLFSGDTHGGQIRLPKWIYKLFGYEKNVKYNYGLFKDGEKAMYVTSGIGTSHFKFRLFRRPEIVVFRF